MAKKPIDVEALTHDKATRKNIPTAEFESVMAAKEKEALRVAYERRNRDLDPQLLWRGKDVEDASDLVASAPPLYIQEKVHPKVIIDDLRRETAKRKAEAAPKTLDLFADFNGLDLEAKTEFYQHDQHWSNRMIVGDSLAVMASLAEREGLRGQVQCIYIDPPYGIKFNSNFQWSTTSRDVKDGAKTDMTREPEQVRAFRDTWRDGVRSYLSYLRDRLTDARDLLSESGSVFVQIGDENVHRVRAVMDEVFGPDNFLCEIAFKTTSSFTAKTLSRSSDYVLWYARDPNRVKIRALLRRRAVTNDEAGRYTRVEEPSGLRRFMSDSERLVPVDLPAELRVYRHDNVQSQGRARDRQPFEFRGIVFDPWPKNSHWKPHYPVGMDRLARADRLALPTINSLAYIRYHDDFPFIEFSNTWTDTQTGAFTESRFDHQGRPGLRRPARGAVSLPAHLPPAGRGREGRLRRLLRAAPSKRRSLQQGRQASVLRDRPHRRRRSRPQARRPLLRADRLVPRIRSPSAVRGGAAVLRKRAPARRRRNEQGRLRPGRARAAGRRVRQHPPRRLRRHPRRRAAAPEADPAHGFAEPPATFERPIVERLVARPSREAAFSGSIKAAYDDTCVFTGLKIVNGGGRSEVQAAHIRPVAASGPDSVRNGIALCGTVHWMFDRGLISIADDHELLFARGRVPDAVMRMVNPEHRLLAPSRPDQAPHPMFLRWHRENVFKG